MKKFKPEEELELELGLRLAGADAEQIRLVQERAQTALRSDVDTQNWLRRIRTLAAVFTESRQFPFQKPSEESRTAIQQLLAGISASDTSALDNPRAPQEEIPTPGPGRMQPRIERAPNGWHITNCDVKNGTRAEIVVITIRGEHQYEYGIEPPEQEPDRNVTFLLPSEVSAPRNLAIVVYDANNDIVAQGFVNCSVINQVNPLCI